MMTQHKLSSRELARGLVTDRFKSIPINRAYANGLIFGTSGQPNLTFQEDSWFNYDASSIGGYEIQKISKKYTYYNVFL